MHHKLLTAVDRTRTAVDRTRTHADQDDPKRACTSAGKGSAGKGAGRRKGAGKGKGSAKGASAVAGASLYYVCLILCVACLRVA